MTREEAIKKLEAFAPMVVDDTREAMDMAIDALQTEGVGRYEKAMQKLREMPKCLYGVKVKQIQKISAEPVKHGKWIEEKDGWYGGQGCRCSSCGYGYSYKAYHEPYEFDFCPNCGAKMDKGGENE